MEIKGQLDATDWLLYYKIFMICSTCFGHHYAHHQELKSIIQTVAACGIWCFGFQVAGLVWSCGLCVRFAGCCSRCNRWVFIAKFLLFAQHVSGTIMPITMSSRVLCVRFAGCIPQTGHNPQLHTRPTT